MVILCKTIIGDAYMKRCPVCNKDYYDSDYYCLKCHYRLEKVGYGYLDKIEEERMNRPPEKPMKFNEKPVVICPYCKSDNTRKITNASKAGSIFLFGIFALSKASKEWHCNKCNSNF